MTTQARCDRGHAISDWMDAYCPTCIRLGLEDIPAQFSGAHREWIRKDCALPRCEACGFKLDQAAILYGAKKCSACQLAAKRPQSAGER